MLAAVAEWPKTRSCQSTANVHRDLLEAIRDDFAKYAGNREKIVKVFAALPRLVGRKFQPRKVDSEEKTLPLRNAFRMLSLARIATPMRRTSANGVPLGAEVDEQYEKVCLLDVGLYSTLSGLDPSRRTPVRRLRRPIKELRGTTVTIAVVVVKATVTRSLRSSAHSAHPAHAPT